MIRLRLSCLVVLTALSCTVPPLDAAGKLCDGPCPAPYACREGRCVGTDGRLCSLLGSAADLCLDFEGSTEVTQPVLVTRGAIKVDTSARRFGPNSLEVSLQGSGAIDLARVAYPLTPTWKRVRVDFDLRPVLPAQVTGVGLSFGEVLCSAAPSYTGVWLFYSADAPGFVVRTGFASETKLAPSFPNAEWTRVTIEVDRSTLRGRVLANGVLTADVAVAECGGTWEVMLGMSGEIRASAWYDDIVVRVDQP